MFYNSNFHLNVFINDVSVVMKTHSRENDVCISRFVGKFQAPTAFIKEGNVSFLGEGGCNMMNNFFKLLSKLEYEYIDRYSSLSSSDVETIKDLISYVESAKWTKSDVTALYCKNWRKTYPELRLIFEEEGFKSRSEVTIRSQISELSRNLCEMFGDCQSIADAFRIASGKYVEGMTKEDGKKFISRLGLKLRMLQGYVDEPFAKKLGVCLFDFDIDCVTENKYKVSECTKELELLKTLSNESIKALCDEVDADKIAYLLQELNKPLLLSQRSEKQKKGSENTYKVNRLVVNTAKIDILQALDLITPKKIKPVGFKNSNINEENLSVDAVTEPVENIKPVAPVSGVEPKAELPFRFDEMSELCEVIQERLNGDMRASTDDIKKRENNIVALKTIFSLFTKKGLKAYLARFGGVEIEQVIKNYRKDMI